MWTSLISHRSSFTLAVWIHSRIKQSTNNLLCSLHMLLKGQAWPLRQLLINLSNHILVTRLASFSSPQIISRTFIALPSYLKNDAVRSDGRSFRRLKRLSERDVPPAAQKRVAASVALMWACSQTKAWCWQGQKKSETLLSCKISDSFDSRATNAFAAEFICSIMITWSSCSRK